MYQEFRIYIIYIRPSSAFNGAADTKIVTFIELIMQMRLLRGMYLMLKQLAHANGVDLKVSELARGLDRNELSGGK